MNMSSPRFYSLIDSLARRLGLGGRTIRRLQAVLRRAKPGDEYTFEFLVKEVDPPSIEDLAAALTVLVDKGVLNQIVRVESPTTHGGIGDYNSIQEVPDELHDWRADEEVRVKPENLRVLYKPSWNPNLALR